MKITFERCSRNPIVTPGLYDWRRAVTFNPGVLLEDGKYYLYERTAGSLRPFHCYIGMMESDDGIEFRHVRPEPVLTPEMLGSKYGSVQDPRVVKLEGRYYMTFAFRPFAWSSHPTGIGVPESHQVDYPGFSGKDEDNQTRSGIAVSEDKVNWKFLSWVNAEGTDDRNVILFPEKIGGRYAVLRRPSALVKTDARHGAGNHPGICISFSKDLKSWTEPEKVIDPRFAWEDNRIGGSTPPIRTEAGWFTLYHGVHNEDAATKRVKYRVGMMLLDLEDPRKVVARCPDYVFEPEAYYERQGLYIPNVVFPTGAVLDGEGKLRIYYGACDTCIGMATASLDELVAKTLDTGRPYAS